MDRCASCCANLNKQETVYAMLGQLYCNERCAVNHLINTSDVEQIAELAVSAYIEEVRADDIGIN